MQITEFTEVTENQNINDKVLVWIVKQISFFVCLFVCLFVYKVLLFKETLNIEKEDTEKESKTFLSHFDKLAYELINGSSNYINYDLSNLSLSHSEASENY